MYDKNIESPFFPKNTDNFDRRYCEAVEKIGLETRERYEAYMQDEEFPLVFRKFTYINVDELSEKPPQKYKQIDRKEYSKSATGNSANTVAAPQSSTAIKYSNYDLVKEQKGNTTGRHGSTVEKAIRSKIKIVPSSASGNNYNSNIIRHGSDIGKNSSVVNANNFNQSSSILNQLKMKETNRHHSQFKERKIIGVASSLIFDDKINKTAIRSSSIKDHNSKQNHNMSSSIINQNPSTSNLNSLINVSNNGLGYPTNNPSGNKLPEIESKLEKIKKLTSNASAANLYSARQIGNNQSKNTQKESGLFLGGIAKKITPTKVLHGTSSTKLSSTIKSYSTINSNREGSNNVHYLTHRERK